MAFLSADPNPVTISPWRVKPKGTSAITWNTGSASIRGKVYYSVDGGPDQLLDDGGNTAGSSSHSIPPKLLPVTLGHAYVVRLVRANEPTAVLAILNVIVQERLGLPDGLVRDVAERVPLDQGISRLVITPGIDTVRIQFQTRQPTLPVIEIWNDASKTLVGAALPLLGGAAKTTHDFEFAPGAGLVEPLEGETYHRVRILAPAADPGEPPREAAGLFRTGFRRATVHFTSIDMINDGDPGFYLGAGDFDFCFGAAGIDGPGFGVVTRVLALSSGDHLELPHKVELPHVAPRMYVQVVSSESDTDWTSAFGETLTIRYENEGSTWHLAGAFEISRVTKHLDLTAIADGPPAEFDLSTGPKHVNYVVRGRVQVVTEVGHVLYKTTKSFRRVSPRKWNLVRAAASVLPGDRVVLGQGRTPAFAAHLTADGGIYSSAMSNAPKPDRWNRWKIDAPRSVTLVAGVDRLHALAIGQSGVLQRASWSPEAEPSQWESLGGGKISALGVNRFADDHIGLWALDANGRMLHSRWSTTSPPDWESAGAGFLPSSLFAMATRDGGTAVIALGHDRKILHRRWTPSGAPDGNWQPIAVAPDGAFSAGLVDDDILLFCVLTADEEVLVIPWRGYPGPIGTGAWSRIESLESLLDARFSILGLLADENASSITIEGRVSAVSGICPNLAFEVNGKYVTTSRSTSFDDGSCGMIGHGTKVKVEGRPQLDATVVAKKVELKLDDVDGPVSKRSGTCPDLSFEIEETFIRTNARTEFNDVACDAIANGMKLEVKGARQADGTLLAASVKTD